MGAILTIDAEPVAFYAIALSSSDLQRVALEAGDAAGQQVLGILNLLIALRLWRSTWQSCRVALEVRSDDVSALTLVSQLKASSPRFSYLAKERASRCRPSGPT